MAKFVMMAGPSGSGKSWYAEVVWKNIEPYNIVISTDAIREQLFGDASCQDKPQKVFGLAYKLITKYLKEGYNVLFDATNLRARNRMRVLKMVKELGVVDWFELVIIKTDLETCIAAQERRDRKVPIEVIERQFKTFEMPSSLEESKWDFVHIIDGKEQNDEINRISELARKLGV